MGLFSFNCKVCGKSIKSVHTNAPSWQQQAVIVIPTGRVMRGSYDGYGRVNGEDVPMTWVSDDTVAETWYHEDCFLREGSPKKRKSKQTPGSQAANDQGLI
jgi:hypothetical protein